MALAAVVAAALLLWSVAGTDVSVPPVLAACLLCGAALGLRSGERARAACAADLARGTRVRAEGLVTGVGARSGSGAGADRARIDLSRATLSADGRECRMPVLAVWTEASGLPPPGARVRATGRWRPYVSVRGVRRPEHRGSLRAGEDGVRRLRPGGGRLEPWSRLRSAAARWRGAAGDRLEERLPPDAAALARALTLADRAGVRQ